LWLSCGGISPDRRQRKCPALRADDRELEVVASPAPEADPDMPYQIIDVAMGRPLQADATRDHPLFAWAVMEDPPEHPGAFVARCWRRRESVALCRRIASSRQPLWPILAGPPTL
jgi:hypothetical protein